MRLSFDSNILVYAADLDAGQRNVVAFDLLRRAARIDCILTLQSLGEFFYTVTRKGKRNFQDAAGFIDDWRSVFPVHSADDRALTEAVAAVRRDSISFWDAMMWATVRQAGCRLLLSEDLHDGQTLGSVTFVNPFAPKNSTLIEAILPREP